MAEKKKDALMQTDWLDLFFEDYNKPTQDELIEFAKMAIELLKIGVRLNEAGYGFADKEELKETLEEEAQAIQFELKKRKDIPRDAKRLLISETGRLALSTKSYYEQRIRNTKNSHARVNKQLTNEQKAELERSLGFLQVRKIPLTEKQLQGLKKHIAAGKTWDKDFAASVMNGVSVFLKTLEKEG